MSQEVPPADLVFGAVGLVIFLAFVFGAGLLLSRFKNARYTRSWAELVPVISGVVTNDGGGAATSWLSGSYRGRPVRAAMVPQRSRYSGESGHHYNYFEVTLLEVAGQHDWSVAYKTPLMGFGAEGWHISAHDPDLAGRLQDAGVIERIAPFGAQEVSYRSHGRQLRYSEDVSPRVAPPPERFVAELELLLALAAINAAVNLA
jgi:hypothetical protein